MIVKNEEEWMEKCLKSAVQIADEIIIVDTGSTDSTKDICNQYHATVYNFDWTESFSKARNFGLKRASGEWILWLDADEELELENAADFKNTLNSNEKNVWMVPLVNYYGTFPPSPNRAYLFASHRLFRNNKGFKFMGNIHEYLNLQQIPEHSLPEIISNAKIHHYGYMDPVVKDKKKYERNLSMLQKERSSPNYSPWIDYHIASEYYRANRYEEAFDQVNLSILRFLQQNHIPPSLLYKLKYQILITLGSFEGAYEGIEKAIDLYPEYVDLHFYKGLILYGKKRFEEAISVFMHCLELGETHIRHLTMAGCGGYLAWYFIGRCFEDIENYADAQKAYTQVLCLYPEYQEVQSRLQNLNNSDMK
jgi:glycosyltransferase involved in cell wall biosynthesis